MTYLRQCFKGKNYDKEESDPQWLQIESYKTKYIILSETTNYNQRCYITPGGCASYDNRSPPPGSRMLCLRQGLSGLHLIRRRYDRTLW
ncbi:hypothetical protein WA026_021128 [Henosepilachna vigintioctopunctata]|uniref:Uncharacterized protein n=1 Tax=Henosepilachna vigintioctopunctata TaxID=420089 RepID=A0AAW1U344_9CUCU